MILEAVEIKYSWKGYKSVSEIAEELDLSSRHVRRLVKSLKCSFKYFDVGGRAIKFYLYKN